MADTKGFFDEYLPNKLAKNPDLANSVKNAIFVFDIDGAGAWTLDLSTPPGSVAEGKAANASCTISAKKADWEAILDNPGKAVQMVMMGKLKVSNLGQATALQKILA
jgi:putative sterol carrier protein